MTTGGRSIISTVTGLFLLAGAGTTQVRQAGGQDLEQAVLTTNAEMARAGEAVDAERMFNFMLDTDKGSVIQNGEFLATRGEALQRVKANLRGISKIEYHWKRQHVTALAADVALLTAEGVSVATTTEGQVVTTPFAQTVVFVMREGHWKALHAHQSSPQLR